MHFCILPNSFRSHLFREAARVYLERTNASVETVNRATEIRTLAERQMGEFLAAMPKATGAQGTGSNQHQVRSHEGTAPQPATLAEIGITKKQSARAQKLAAIPADEFKERIAVAKAGGGAAIQNAQIFGSAMTSARHASQP